jgi:chemotaxis protein MotA
LVDLATIIGRVGAPTVVSTAIFLGGSVGAFVNTPALVLVIGGTLLVTLMKFSFRQFLNANKIAFKAFGSRAADAEDLIDRSIMLATEARANGLLALEDADVPDEFFRTALNLVVDGHDPEVVRTITA